MRKVTVTMWFLAFALIANTALSHSAEPVKTHPSKAKEAVSAPLTKVDINKGGLEELEAIKGVGPALAERIMTYRKENGNFKTPEDLMNVKGIGQAKFSRIKEQVIV